jgi:predicted metal-dependent hydrolase
VRIAILIKDVSRRHKWRSAQDEIEKAKEIASIKNDKQDLIADLHKKIENLTQEKR